MAKQCLFCDNEANSKEHLWSDWILQRLGTQPTRIKMGKAPAKHMDHSVVEVRCVCRVRCNAGWMSALESENIPIIGRLMENAATSLDATQQTSLALWTVMKAMVLDAVNDKNRGRFFTRKECESLRLERKIPDKTTIQIGAYTRKGYMADGTIVWLDFPNAPKAAKASVSTFVIGHLAVQVVTVHHEPQHENDPIRTVAIGNGELDKLLLQIWPAGTLAVAWPPQATFTDSGSSSIHTLQNRWRLGKDATI
jgi:hypothetical protein